MNITASYKTTGGNYRQFLDIKNIDGCNVLENIFKFPPFTYELIYVNTTMFPGFIHKCPYKSFKVINATMMSNKEQEENLKKYQNQTKIQSIMPNGLYRLKLQFWTDFDEQLLELIYFFERYQHLQDFSL